MAVTRVRTEFEPVLGASRWDWYQVTVDAERIFDIRPHLDRAYPMADWRPTRPQNGYHTGEGLFIGDRRVLLLCHGGNRGTANIMATSDDSPALASALRQWGGPFKPTRVDSCLDWEEPGLFDALAASLLGFAHDKGLKVNQQGDWSRGRSRTLYIGSSQSPVQLRLYEKGYQLQGDDTARPNWVRLEVQVRASKERRAALMQWAPSDAWGAGWVAEAVERFFLVPGTRFPVGYIKQDSDRFKRRAWLLKTAARALREWIEDCDGDLLEFGLQVAQGLAEEVETE